MPETLEGHAQALWPYDDVLRRRELKIIVDLDKVVPAALPAGPWHRPPNMPPWFLFLRREKRDARAC